MHQLLWKTLRATGITDAAKTATGSLVSTAARQLAEVATAEFERRWTDTGAGTRKPAGRALPRRRTASSGSRGGSSTRGASSRGGLVRGGQAYSGAARQADRPAAVQLDQDSLHRLRATIAALDARIDTLADD